MSKSDKLKALATEVVGFVNAMRSHFEADLEGASLSTCISYGECVGMLHNAANMLGRDIARLSKEESATYRPGILLNHEGWDKLIWLREFLIAQPSNEPVNLQRIVSLLDEAMRPGLSWVGGEPE